MAATKAPTPSAATPASAAPPAPSSSGQGPKPLIAPSYSPTPAQQNPAVRRTLAPTLPPEDQRAPNPVTEARERSKAAIASRLEGHEGAQRGGFGGAATPPKQTATSSAQPRSPASGATERSAAASASSAGTPTSSSAKSAEAPASSEPENALPAAEQGESKEKTPAASSAPAPLSFTPKEFKKWAQANPEEALAFREAIDKDSFRLGEDTKQEWIRQTQRSRKLRDDLRAKREEFERDVSARETKVREQLQLAENSVQSIRYLSEMWGAANGKDAQGNRVIDFDAVEEAFKQNTGGLSISDFQRLNARRGVANPEAARLRADLRRAELELQRTKTNGAAGSSERPSVDEQGAASSAPPAAPAGVSPGLHANPEDYWGDELPAEHPLRRLQGWGKLLDHAMLQWHDDVLDEYSRDAEDIATEVFKRQLAALTGGAEPEPEKVTVKPHARNKPATPRNRQAAIRRAAPAEDGAPTNVAGLGIAAHKLVPRGQVNTDRSHYEIPKEKWGDVARSTGGIETIRRTAIERARMRAQGIDPDTGGEWQG